MGKRDKEGRDSTKTSLLRISKYCNDYSVTMASSTLVSLFLVLSMATSAIAQDPPISSSEPFVLYPYITTGSLTGPYSNADIDKSQPFDPLSGTESPYIACYSSYPDNSNRQANPPAPGPASKAISQLKTKAVSEAASGAAS